MYSFEVSKSTISASEPQKMMVLWRFETMTLLMRHPVFEYFPPIIDICIWFVAILKAENYLNIKIFLSKYIPTLHSGHIKHGRVGFSWNTHESEYWQNGINITCICPQVACNLLWCTCMFPWVTENHRLDEKL